MQQLAGQAKQIFDEHANDVVVDVERELASCVFTYTALNATARIIEHYQRYFE